MPTKDEHQQRWRQVETQILQATAESVLELNAHCVAVAYVSSLLLGIRV